MMYSKSLAAALLLLAPAVIAAPAPSATSSTTTTNAPTSSHSSSSSSTSTSKSTAAASDVTTGSAGQPTLATTSFATSSSSSSSSSSVQTSTTSAAPSRPTGDWLNADVFYDDDHFSPVCLNALDNDVDHEFVAKAYLSSSSVPAYQACYIGGTQNFTEADANVTKCLTNLHYTNKNAACIPVAGNCDLNDYIKNGGRIQNTKLNLDRQLTAGESSLIQGGIDQLVGQLTQTSNHGANNYSPQLMAISDDSNAKNVTGIVMTLDYIGQSGC